MSKANKIKVGISIGDINGIGIEIILKTFEDSRMFDFCTPIIFGSSRTVSYHKKAINSTVQVHGVQNTSSIVNHKLNLINVWNEAIPIELGTPTKIAGKHAFLSLQAATNALKNNEIDVLVTAPINKHNIQSDKFDFPGHTEYLEANFEGESLMILMTDKIKIGLITGHIPIKNVAEAINEDLITRKVSIMCQTLTQDFGITKPKIAVLGLNPHCGDNGVIGTEEQEIIIPTINKLQNDGILVFGPYAADAFFGTENFKNFDGVLAMYHDQGLAPFKAIAFNSGVNYTAGLSKIRTSPDHGTAYEIAGKGIANNKSFEEALFKAIEIFNKRNEYKNLIKNKLNLKSDK